MSLILRDIPTSQNAADYYLDDRLKRAVELAYALDKPLLLSGEPGTGKTQLAYKVADLLASQTHLDAAPFLSKPIVFDTKSGSSAADLFYAYDAVRHFRSKESVDTNAYVDFAALGKARILAHGRDSGVFKNPRIQPLLGRCAELLATPQSSVVLIDEVDKAPREFPNDLLNEMETGRFRIPELDFTLEKAGNSARVLVILTSNFEKSLPNAFLRRCVFYHIPFPNDDHLLEIVSLRLGLRKEAVEGRTDPLTEALRRFKAFRERAAQTSSRVPSTAEFLDWLRVLKADDLLTDGDFPPKAPTANEPPSSQRVRYESSLVVLQKDKDASMDAAANPLLA